LYARRDEKRITHFDFRKHLFSDVNNSTEIHFAVYSLLGNALLSSVETKNKKAW